MQIKIIMKMFLFRVGQLNTRMKFLFLKDLYSINKGTTTTKGKQLVY